MIASWIVLPVFAQKSKNSIDRWTYSPNCHFHATTLSCFLTNMIKAVFFCKTSCVKIKYKYSCGMTKTFLKCIGKLKMYMYNYLTRYINGLLIHTEINESKYLMISCFLLIPNLQRMKSQFFIPIKHTLWRFFI